MPVTSEKNKSDLASGGRSRLLIAEMMGLVIVIAALLKWPGLTFPVLPFALMICMRRIGFRPRKKVWIATLGAYLIALGVTQS